MICGRFFDPSVAQETDGSGKKSHVLQMVQAQLSPAASEVVDARPICPECGVKMWLVRVERAGPHTTKRIFECPACEVALEQH